MKAKELFDGICGRGIGNWEDVEVRGLSDDSRRVKEGYAFFCRRGESFDGHAYAEDALRRKASLIVAEKPLPLSVPQLVVPSVLSAAQLALRRFYNHADAYLFKVGVTGTNGKTTVSSIVRHGFEALGYPFGLIGTVSYFDGKRWIKPKNTTPGLFQLWEIMGAMRDNGLYGFSVEVSSHALKQRRIGDVRFDVSVFTNLSRDHLDYHKSMEDYFSSKLLLFREHTEGFCVLNGDDNWGRRIASEVRQPVVFYGIESGDIRGRIVDASLSGMVIEVDGMRARTLLLGEHNLYNILAAYSVFAVWGMGKEFLKEALPEFQPVKGRLERIEKDGITVFVDYAHTPDALFSVLKVLKPLASRRLITVFGCGGDRDKGKRPEMGRVASLFSDVVVVTSDNPRSEDPGKIIEDILRGIEGVECVVIPDRRSAIFEALSMAERGDVILVAGKGHEDYQIVGDRVIHFDDVEVVKEALGIVDEAG